MLYTYNPTETIYIYSQTLDNFSFDVPNLSIQEVQSHFFSESFQNEVFQKVYNTSTSFINTDITRTTTRISFVSCFSDARRSQKKIIIHPARLSLSHTRTSHFYFFFLVVVVVVVVIVVVVVVVVVIVVVVVVGVVVVGGVVVVVVC